jgi:hypothetical protein
MCPIISNFFFGINILLNNPFSGDTMQDDIWVFFLGDERGGGASRKAESTVYVLK